MAKLKIGDNAPSFETTDSVGKNVRLSGLKGKKIVLYFYPKDSTPGCTIEACNFRDDIFKYRRKGIVILGVSGGSDKSHNKFIVNKQLNFPLLMDEDFMVAKAYGAYGKKKFLGKEYKGITRMTFLIDKKGKIAKIYDKVNVMTHSEDILKEFKL